MFMMWKEKKKGEGRLRFVEHLCRDVYFNWLHILIYLYFVYK